MKFVARVSLIVQLGTHDGHGDRLTGYSVRYGDPDEQIKLNITPGCPGRVALTPSSGLA